MQKAPTRNRDWLSAILLFLLIQVAVARLVTTNWATDLYFAETLAAYGAVLGLALGGSRFARGVVIWLAIAYSVFLVPWVISDAVKDKLLLDRLGHVGGILLVSLGQFFQRQPVKDPLFFVAFVCLVFWLLSVLAGYWLARHGNVLVAIIPSGTIVLIVQVYANYQAHSSWWLATYLFVAFLLIGRVYYLQSRTRWTEQRVYVGEEAWTNILGGLFVTVALAVVIAWLFPTSISSVQAATDVWTNATHGIRERLSNAVTSLSGPYGKPGTNFYGSSLPLGQNAASGDSTMFDVEVQNEPPSNMRFYWRGQVYDTYQDGQWTNTPASTFEFQPSDSNVRIPFPENRFEALLNFTMRFSGQTLLYAPSGTVWIDRPADVSFTPTSTGFTDILAWQAKRSIPNGSAYEVRAELANPDAQALRATGTGYPQWIQGRYLQIPNKIRPAFQALAEEVTAGQATPYDKAAAITNYLRANLQYSTNVPRPPEGQDPIQWVLFDYRRGFCNYYASAEVLMLRSVGVPARLAVGFAQGEHQGNHYIVRRRDAHAWPEVFFPGIGWVEFEPTVSQYPLVRSDSSRPANGNATVPNPLRRPDAGGQPGNHEPEGAGAQSTIPFGRTIAGRLLTAAVWVLALALLVYLLYRYHALTYMPVVLSRAFESSGVAVPAWVENWERWDRLEPVERPFASVNWSLRFLGQPAPIDATAVERAKSLKKLLPSAAEPIDTVELELERGLFTESPADVRRAWQASYRILFHAVRARLRAFVGMSDGRDVYSG